MRNVLFSVTIALVALQFVLLALGRSTVGQITPAVVAVGYAISGRLLITSVARNAVGWIIGVIGSVLALAGLSNGYLDGAPDSDPLWAFQLAGMISGFAWNIWLPSLVTIALALLFPDGRLLSRRWRWVAWSGAFGVTLSSLGLLLAAGPIEGTHPAPNPLGLDLPTHAAFIAGQVVITAASVAALAALGVRLRRSRGVERQQLKWIAYVLGLAIAGLFLATALTPVRDTAWGSVIGPIGWFTALIMIAVGIPIATGFAVLKHRLYDIDVVIKRTLIYGALTATLGGAYLGSILLLQLILSPSSDLAIAASTLAVATLVRPLRARIQLAVNHRFYRSEYDAQRTIATFGARMRNTVSLESLADELSGVVHDTMHPAHVSVWLVRR